MDKVNRFEREKVALDDKAMESELVAAKSKRVWIVASGYASIAFGFLLANLPALKEGIKGKDSSDFEKNVMLVIGLVNALWGLMVTIFGFAGYDKNYSEYENRLKELMQDEKVSEDINRELVRLAPVLENMLKAISEKYPETGKKLLENKLSEQDASQIADFMRNYLKAHPNYANQFVSLLTVTQTPQEIIDKFVAEYVPGTITFNMAQKLAAKSAGNERNG